MTSGLLAAVASEGAVGGDALLDADAEARGAVDACGAACAVAECAGACVVALRGADEPIAASRRCGTACASDGIAIGAAIALHTATRATIADQLRLELRAIDESVS